MEKRSKKMVIAAAVSMGLNFLADVFLLVFAVVIGIYHGTMPTVVNGSVLFACIVVIWPLVSFVLSVLALVFSVKAKRAGESKNNKKILAALLEFVIMLSGFIYVAVTYITQRGQF